MNAAGFTPEDWLLFRRLAVGKDEVERQMRNFQEGFPYLDVTEAATPGRGILVPGEAESERRTAGYEKYIREGGKVVKFVPASGAATRMFRDLYPFADGGECNDTVRRVLDNLDDFAFWERLRDVLPEDASGRRIISALVGPGLNYGSTPKALVLFHKYPGEARTALEEHLCEGALYASDGKSARLHFTVSPEHKTGFEALLAEVLPKYERRFGIGFVVELSEQDSSTDTVAANPDNTPFRNDDGSLLLRPAGHGALLKNLQSLDADLVFIKNIDNVTTDDRRGDTVRYKKILAGILVELQAETFALLAEFDAGIGSDRLAAVARFAEERLMVRLPAGFGSRPENERRSFLRRLLDRPIRVCGMVRNEGEPGGGPFWAVNPDGTQSLQIAESNQIAPGKKHLSAEGTHFNPVDLVCGIRNYRGEKFDLGRYVDRSAGLISFKSKDGRPLKAQELPGLWNGSMSDWNTVFVEVPLDTFTPVKEVTDLLRAAHLPEYNK